MISNKTRTRTRITPLPRSGIVKLGMKSTRLNVNQAWGEIAPTPLVYDVSSLGYPGAKAQITEDEVHPGPPYRSGGPFRSLKIVSCEPFAHVVANGVHFSSDNLVKYEGGLYPPTTTDFGVDFAPYVQYGTQLKVDNPDWLPSLGTWGDVAYKRLTPQMEKAGGGVFIGELRDLPRMLKTTGKTFHDIWNTLSNRSGPSMAPKKAADHFLNHQFGWRPFLKDMSKFVDVFNDSGNIIRKLSDENGQWIRRRVTLHEQTTRAVVASGTGMKLSPYPFGDDGVAGRHWFSTTPTWQVTHEITRVISAVGKFRYYRPEFDPTLPDYSSALNNVARHLTIYGVRVTPSNLYKITPWTWAIDWVSNFGDYIDRVNAMAVDSVSAQYLYVMQHIKTERKFYLTLPWLNGTVQLEFIRRIEGKRRDEGLSPYGFNLDWTNLTSRQLLIAGALGISRG